MLHRLTLLAALASLALASLPSPTLAQEIARREGPAIDTWSEPHPGVRHLLRTVDEPATVVHALVVDLRAPGVRLATTAEDDRWDTVSGLARREGAVAAINGGFWGVMQSPTGITAGGGALWGGSAADPDFGHFGLLEDGRAVVRGPGEGEEERDLARLEGAVSGRPLLVVDGEPATALLDAFGTANQRQPRTAVGVSRDGRRVVLVVADGRQAQSRGVTLYQLARVMVELGAHRAINLDGGGSSTMYVERAGGIVSSPARGRWARALGLGEDETARVRTRRGEQEVYVRGVEREVMNHVLLFAPTREVAVARQDDVLLDGLGHLLGPRGQASGPGLAARRPFRLGVMREWLYPSLYALLALALLSGTWVAARRTLRSVRALSTWKGAGRLRSTRGAGRDSFPARLDRVSGQARDQARRSLAVGRGGPIAGRWGTRS